MDQQCILALDKITKRFPLTDSHNKYFYALDNVSLTIHRNDFVVLGGANGSGKSLLMTIMAGLVKPSSGKVSRTSPVGLIFQNPDTQILGETPWEDVSIGPKNLGIKEPELSAIIRHSLEAVDLHHKAHFPARNLSGGEKRRLATAGIRAMDRQLIIFDEPFANLDYPSVRRTTSLLAQLHQEGKTIVVLTHEIEKCLALANRFMVLHNGRLVFDGLPQDGLTQNLEDWGIRNPLNHYSSLQDLLWT